tara:strand:+ start:94620 stop:95195 length:576 start_codon:yes stop_codon:yes gene_type:complete
MKTIIQTYHFSIVLILLSACAGKIPNGYLQISKSSSLYRKEYRANQITHTAHKSSLRKPILSFAGKNRFFIYAVNNSETKWIRVVFEYSGLDRLLFEKIMIKSNNTDKLEWKFSRSQNNNNRHGGIVQEKKDLLITNSEYEKLKEIVNLSTKIKYRFSSGFEQEFSISKDDLKNFSEIIKYYESIPVTTLD